MVVLIRQLWRGERTALEKGVDGPLDVSLCSVQEEVCLRRRRPWKRVLRVYDTQPSGILVD